MSSAICSICNSPRSDDAGPCAVCGAAPAAPVRNLPAGTHLQNGKFTLGRVLGDGGFGITYKGAHRPLQRVVAIKELFPEDAVRRGTSVLVPEQRQTDFRLEREQTLEEARSIARLDSPHVVTVHDVFLENGTAYIVMEYLEGQTLQDQIEEAGPLSMNEVRAIAIATCDALIEVHRQSLLHRDIKPSNIMLTHSGRTVLVDFGSARPFALHQTVRHTRILTRDYAAPEMFSTHAHFGPYTDIFCLGGTLYHALTGTPPPSVPDRFQNPHDELRFPVELRGPMCDVIRQALQVRVENRPQSAAAFKSGFLDPIVSVAEDMVDLDSPTRLPSEPATAILRDTMRGHAARVLSVAFHPNGLMLASGGADHTVRLWDMATGTLWKTLDGHRGTVHSVAFSPDGWILASGGADRVIRLWDTTTGALWKTLGGHEEAVYSVVFSSEGGTLASSGADRVIRLWDVDAGAFRQTLWGHVDRIYSVAFSPDGRTLASSGGDNTVRLWDVDAEMLRHTLKNHKGNVFSVAFSPDGRTLASGGSDGARLWDAATGACLSTLKWRTGSTGGVNGVTFSPDGQTLASSSYSLCLWDANTGVLHQTLAASSGSIYSVTFSPNGQILASGGADMTIRLWEQGKRKVAQGG